MLVGNLRELFRASRCGLIVFRLLGHDFFTLLALCLYTGLEHFLVLSESLDLRLALCHFSTDLNLRCLESIDLSG